MKKKKAPVSDPVVPRDILEKARKAAHPDKLPAKRGRCIVCGGDCSTTSAEQLCWVCRRLKISAQESEQQMPAQE